MLTLKNYQTQTLGVLKDYLEKARFTDALQAYDLVQKGRYGPGQPFTPYRPLEKLPAVPYVCLRLPTGGGKTLLAAHSIQLAGDAYLERTYPLTLWMVPSDVIKQQTIETLLDPNNANRKVLEKAFDGRFRVFDIEDFNTIRPQDVRDSVCIILTTFQSFRVSDTDIRKVYAHNEELEGHFTHIPPTTEGLQKQENSKVRYSFANLLHWARPLVLVDEAHNASSPLQFDVMERLNPACVVEFTATPAPNSNVIHSVSAAQLKAEEMIKLPIRLHEHKSWEAAITASIGELSRLADLANKDKDYIRPIILFQAQNKGQDVTVEVVKNYLMENENIPEKEIVVATGDEKGLKDINLFATDCPVKYVITVQALREGWDCSFAYILCSLANVQSRTAVEQLLGRVLRMPHARLRSQPDLNMAYAHVASNSWPHAATQLRDKLVQMGFEKQEAEEIIIPQPSLPLGSGQIDVSIEVHLKSEPDMNKLDIADRMAVVVTPSEAGGFVLKVNGKADSKLLEKLHHVATDKADREEIALKANIKIKHMAENLTPSQRGLPFVVPQLCFNLDGDIELAEKEICLGYMGWSILDYYKPLAVNDFTVTDTSIQFEVDIDEVREKVTVEYLDVSKQTLMEGVFTDWTDIALVQWLDRRLRQHDILPEQLVGYLTKVVRDLLGRSDLDLSKLARAKFMLEKVLADKIAEARKEAAKKGFQGLLDLGLVITDKSFNMTFDPNHYPVSRFYEGHYKFRKHYYPMVGELNGEEAECAMALDRCQAVEWWVRNLERQPKHSFSLQTSSDRFYPDFVAKLKDGRMLVVEYKGAQFVDTPDVKEKTAIGDIWAKNSGNLFLMGWHENGGDIYQQLERILEG